MCLYGVIHNSCTTYTKHEITNDSSHVLARQYTRKVYIKEYQIQKNKINIKNNVTKVVCENSFKH